MAHAKLFIVTRAHIIWTPLILYRVLGIQYTVWSARQLSFVHCAHT